jgi:hypothetical protein
VGESQQSYARFIRCGEMSAIFTVDALDWFAIYRPDSATV